MSKKIYDNSIVNSFPEKFKMELPDGYRIDIEYDEDGEQNATLRGGFSFNDEGEETSEFSAAFITMNSTIENRENLIKEGKLKDHFVPGLMLEQAAVGMMEQLQEQFGPGTRFNMYDSYPASVVMKFYKPFSIFGVTLESYVVMYLVEVTENLFFGFNTVYQNNEDGNDVFYRHLFNVIKSIRVNSKAVDTGDLTAGKLEAALDMDPGDDVEAINIGASIGINIQNGDEETRLTLNSDGSISEETVPFTDDELPDEDDMDDFEDDAQDTDGILDTLRINDSYERSFLHEHGMDIKRMIATGYGYVNYITLSECPNVEEFIVDNNSAFSFVDGVLYSQRGNTRTIEYVTGNVKHLHIDADVTDVSSYWHGVEEVTVDPKNNTFTVQGDMLLSRRKNTLFFVTSKAEEVIIPEGVTQIHCRAFQYCENIKRVVFPASYKWEGWHAANSDPILITPENMKDAEIVVKGDYARYENGMVVTSMGYRPEPKLYLGDRKLCRIPAGMTQTFGFDQAFAYVENFEVSKDNQALSSADGVILDKSGEKLEFYPRARKNFVIPASVSEIVSHSAANCNELTEITIPAHVKAIGQMAFANCSCLSKVTTLNPDIKLHDQAYFGCHALNGDGFDEPVDEEELKKSVAKEIREIRRSNKRNKDSSTGFGGGLFGWGSFMSGPAENEVKIAEDDNRKVIVDDKWSFRLPEGLELRFDSEHVDITGSTTTAKYVIEGLEYNGRFFFDFELRERFEDGMSTDVDVIGCRHDSSVTSGNAHQKIIRDDDDLYVDLISKPVFFFSSMASIRVRGDNIRSWDFTAGLKSNDEEMSDRWKEVNALMEELAKSIELLDAAGKSRKKKKKTESEANSDPDFVISNGVLRKYIGDKKNIVIPDGVKEIADSAFSGYSSIKSVTVPEGVKRIGRRCFENCLSLRNCYLPDSLEELGGYAFVDCHELKEVYLSDKIKSLGDSTFSECFVMKDVKLPKKIKEIDAFAFKNCDAFTHIVIPKGVTSIGFSAFASCDNLEYLFIPDSVTDIQVDFTGSHPFAGSSKLTIYTPAGSYAQEFAEEHGIPYENAAKGKVTADNARVKTGAEGTHSASAVPEKGSGDFAYATPDESLYPHYDSKPANQGVNFFGISIISNPSGTDYEFYQLADRIDEDASDELKEAVAKLDDTGAANYKLADKAVEMRSVFHVSPDIFDFRHDRECELANDLMQKAYMMSGLRSFAWTLSRYCEDHKVKPADLSLGQIQAMIDFIADRDWLNYNGVSYCKSLCGTSDVHVYYLPDKTPEAVKAVFETSEQDLEDARKMKEQFPSYNPIFSQIGSLDGLRKDLEYIYPAIEKIYEDLKSSRDFSEPLTGNDSDILYAWCALAYAARAPFFSEDGPTMYMHSQIKSEEELQAEYEERRRKAIEERAEMSKKFMASYGKYIEKNPKIIFTDKKFVFTGLKARVFEIDDDTDYKQLIEDRGGLTRKSVSGVTDYLVIDPAGAGESKITTAIENQNNGKPIKIILLDDLRKALGLQADKASKASAEPAPEAAAAVSKTVSTPSAAKSAPVSKAKAPEKKRTSKPASAASSSEKTVTVGNNWDVTIPAGFKYSTDKKIIGDHRDIIIMEDKSGNDFSDPFNASISFTSMFNACENDNMDGQTMARMMNGILGTKNATVLEDDQNIYVSYYYEPGRSYKEADESLDVFSIRVGTSKGCSSVQVFFNESTQSRREMTKLVEKVAKSIKPAGQGKKSISSGASDTSDTSDTVLSPEQQRQKDELNRQIEDLKSQAAYYTSRSDELSAEDRATLAQSKEEIKNLENQMAGMSVAQDKFADHLRQREETERKREEERQRKIAEAKAAGKSEVDEAKMYVLLCSEAKAHITFRTQKELYEAYKDDFPAYNQKELAALKKDVRAKMKDKEACRRYAEIFRNRPLKERFDLATGCYLSYDLYADYSLKAEDSIAKTAEWYSAEEMPDVRRLMKEMLGKLRNDVDNAFDPIETKWKKYWSAKEFLKVFVKNESDADIRKDCRLFQIKDTNEFDQPVIIEAVLATKGLLQLSTPVINFFSYYWDVSADEIWEEARKNGIDDSSSAYFDDVNVFVRNAIRRNKTSNPDPKSLLTRWESGVSGSARTFGGYISRLYSSTDKQFTITDIKENLKASYKTENDLAEGKEKLFEYAKRENLSCLRDLLKENTDIKELYGDIPKALGNDIKVVRERKQLEANKNKYSEATALLEKDSLKDLIKAESILNDLGSFKDAKSLLKQCSAKIENVKTAQYDEAISLKKEGTEASELKSIEILTSLGDFKDAQQKASEYRKELDRRHKLEEIKTLSQSDSLTDLSRAIKMLEEFRAESANAEALIGRCSSKIESIKEERYTQAISLAEEGTETSLDTAILKLETIDPYKDSGDRIIQFKKQLENEKAYLSAAEHLDDSNIGELVAAKVIFEQLGDYKDSVSKAAKCDSRINEISENIYQEGLAAEKIYSLESQSKAISKYNQIGTYKDSFERKNKCSDNCKTIRAIQDLKKEIEADRSELAALTGIFKGKERKAKEAQISAKEKRVDELNDKLNGQYKESEEKAGDEKADVPEKGATAGKKSRKKWIFVFVILAVIAALGIMVIPNLMKTDLTKHGDMVSASIRGLQYKVPEDWKNLNLLHTDGPGQIYTLSKGKTVVAVLDVKYCGDADLEGDAGVSEHEDYDTAIDLVFDNNDLKYNITDLYSGSYRVNADSSEFEISLWSLKDTSRNQDEFLLSIKDTFDTAAYRNPRVLKDVKINYKGSTKSGVKVENENIEVYGEYDTGEAIGTTLISGWTLSNPPTFEAGKTSTITISFDGKRYTADVACSDPAPEDEENDDGSADDESTVNNAGGGTSASGTIYFEP